MQPNIHEDEVGISPEELQYARSMGRVNQDQELSQVQAENEASFLQQKLEETSQRAEMAEASAEQAGQQAQQAQATADQATQQLQQTQQEMGAQLQQTQTESMASNEELMRLRQGIQDYRQQLQQLALSDPTAPPAPPQVDPATGQPVDPAMAQGQAASGQEQAQAQPGQEVPKQSEAVPPMLAPGSGEMPPGMPGQMPPGMELGGGQEGIPGEMEEEGMQGGLDLENMPEDELMELLEAIQGELEMRDQEEVEANDTEHQHAMGIAENAVAASKSKTAGAALHEAYNVGRAISKLPRENRGKLAKELKPLLGLNTPESIALHLGQHRNKYLAGASIAAGTAAGVGLHAAHHAGKEDKGKEKTAGVTLVRQLCSARPFVKAADAINLIPNRRYGIETDHKPGALEKNSDGIPPHGKAAKKELGGKQ
jgi:hypothetical protein